MERTRTEIGLFATAALGVWLLGAGIVVTNKWLVGFAILLILLCLSCFALRNSE